VTSLRKLVESARFCPSADGLPHGGGAAFARLGSLFFSLSVLTFVISLAASEAFLFAAALCYAIYRVRAAGSRPATIARTSQALRFPFPPVRLPVALFCLLTVLSAFGAPDPASGWPAVRKLVLFLIMLLAVALPSTQFTVSGVEGLRSDDPSRTMAGAREYQEALYAVLFFASALAGAVGAFQFAAQYRRMKAAHPGQVYLYMSVSRIHGFMGHWMNFGGQQMLVFCALLAYLLFSKAKNPEAAHLRQLTDSGTGDRREDENSLGWGKTAWLLLSVVALSIALNLTRGVWLGCFVAVVYLVARWRPRWLLLLPLLIALGYFAGPSLVRERLDSLLHPARDPSIAIRLEMWQVALRMIRAHPGLGVGPNNVEREYALYLPPGETPIAGYHGHFHNNLLQLGAERGLACLGAWVWMMVALVWGLVRLRREPPASRETPAWVVEAAIAGWLAFAAEGFFEFNFGTSPVLMLFLFVVSLPFARGEILESASRQRDSQGAG
jgi:O-antigen ligase/polysaccharide polymerase Wzy-like membrane protein